MIIPLHDPPPMIYQHPGADPYRGTHAEALNLLYPAARPYISREAFDTLETTGYCRIRSWHQNEVVNAMTYGKQKVSFGVVVDVNSWPLNASRLIEECTDGLGNAIGIPEVCGNVYYERIPPFVSWATPPAGEGWAPATPNGISANGITPNDNGDNAGDDYGGSGYRGGYLPSVFGNGGEGLPSLLSSPPSPSVIIPPSLPPSFTPPIFPPENTPPTNETTPEPKTFLTMLMGILVLFLTVKGIKS